MKETSHTISERTKAYHWLPKQIKELSVLMSNYIKLTYKRYNIKKIGIENNYTNLVLMVPVEASPVL
jgi:hypothetical protein